MSDAREDEADVAGTEPPGSLSDPEARALAAAAAAAELSGPGVHVRFCGRSSVGLVREHNEDNLLIANLTTGDIAIRDAVQADTVGEGGHLFAVCDGMGGAAAGEVASQMAVDILLEALRRSGPPRERDELARRLVSAVEEAGKRIFESAQKERSRRGMGTTATVAVLVDKVLFIAEVGDSRAYLLRGGVLKQLTKDQSLVNQLIEAGHLTEAEAEAFEHSNIILQALGTSETVQVDLTFVELRRGDRLMLCSDGLSGLVHVDSLRDTLIHVIDPSECAGMLTKYAEQGGGHDNITVVVVDFGGDGLPELRDTDTFGYLQYPLLPVAGAKNVYSDDEVTEATSSRSSMPPEGLRSLVESSMPPSGGASSVLWVSAGIVVLLGGAWLLAVSGSNGSAATEPTASAPPQIAPADPKLVKAAPVAEPKPVQVRVFSDVRDAVLLVNGEPHGPLTMGQAASMQLKPGAYRFEAQANGNIAAVEVATVRPEVPLEVNLRLPTGHSAEGENKAAEPSEGPAVAAPLAPEKAPEQTAEAPKKPSASTGEPAEKPTRAASKRKSQVSQTLTEELNSGASAPVPQPNAPVQAAPPAAAHPAPPAAAPQAPPAAAAPQAPPAAVAHPPVVSPAPVEKPAAKPAEKPKAVENPPAAEKPAEKPVERPAAPGIPDNPF